MTEQDTSDKLRVFSPAQITAWAEGGVKALRLRTYRDIMPGGFMAALAPALIDWDASDPFGDEPFVVIRNVNYGGNPLEKTTVLHQVQVPLTGIAFVEFTLVPSTKGGLHALAHHAQLRFVFEPEKRPVLLALANSAAGSAAHIPDLVLSWESWHETSVRYSGFKGLDASSYKLSLRAYAGPQRFLEDTLHGRPWYSYRLRIPGGGLGASELLKVALALGDDVARHTISQLLKEGEEDCLKHAPSTNMALTSSAEWDKLRSLVRKGKTYEDPNLSLSSDQESYQTLVRSCATMARYSVLTATKRVVGQGLAKNFDSNKIPQPLMGNPSKWMTDVARSNLTGMFVRAPLALALVIRHPESVPDRVPEELAAANLMERRAGKAWVTKYAPRETRPYDRSGCYGVDYAS